MSQMPPQPAACTSYDSSGSGCVHKHCLSRLLWYKCGSGSSAAALALSGSNQTGGCSQAVLLWMSAVVSSAPDRKGVVEASGECQGPESHAAYIHRGLILDSL